MSNAVLVRNPPLIRHNPPHVLERLSDPAFGAGGDIAVHVAYANTRWRTLTGLTGTPPTQVGQVAAFADYVTNLAKHPFRHAMNSEVSDPRAGLLFVSNAVALLNLAVENQTWNGSAWVPAAGKTLAADVVPLECTWQHGILGLLCAWEGWHWMLLDIAGHTAFAVYLPELRDWMYIESTFNEHYRLASSSPSNYKPLSPLELQEISLRGAMAEIVPVQGAYQPQRSAPGGSYYLPPYKTYSPNGWAPMAAHLDGRCVRARVTDQRNREERVLPTGTGATYFAPFIAGGWVLDRDTLALFPPLGECHAVRFGQAGDTVTVELASTLGGSTGYERSLNSGAWTACGAADQVKLTAGQRVQWRAVAGLSRSGVVEARRS